jgi:NTE family protein
MSSKAISGLVVTGGGARGAYQVGVLKAVSEILESRTEPFDIISGISVGGLNAAGLASVPEDFVTSAKNLELFWRSLTTAKVFDPRLRKIFLTALKLGFATLLPKHMSNPPKSLLDSSPLRQTLLDNIDFGKVAKAVQDRAIKAISVTCSGYDSGYAVTFFDTLGEEKDWHRVRRAGRKRVLDIDEVMASAALPLLFPAVKIDNEYFGDGALRQTSPLAPAIHLGADKLFIIGTRDSPPEPHETIDFKAEYPSAGDLGGYALDIIFHDSLESDIERLKRLNTLVRHLTPEERAGEKLKEIDVFSINPSISLRSLAREHAPEMPRRLRWLIKRRTAEAALGRIESYLLFEPGYIGALIDLGYKDAMARREEIRDFFPSSKPDYVTTPKSVPTA